MRNAQRACPAYAHIVLVSYGASLVIAFYGIMFCRLGDSASINIAVSLEPFRKKGPFLFATGHDRRRSLQIKAVCQRVWGRGGAPSGGAGAEPAAKGLSLRHKAYENRIFKHKENQHV